MMKLDQIFKEEAENDDEAFFWRQKPFWHSWMPKPEQSLPQFLLLTFNHQAGQFYFTPVVQSSADADARHRAWQNKDCLRALGKTFDEIEADFYKPAPKAAINP